MDNPGENVTKPVLRYSEIEPGEARIASSKDRTILQSQFLLFAEVAYGIRVTDGIGEPNPSEVGSLRWGVVATG